MDEFKYCDVPSPFPTLAKGLFTREILDSHEEKASKTFQIVARGYDKFFNVGEVPWTTWKSLEAHTAAPYTLSQRSNGCIIFIAALTPTKLLITSKYSLGPLELKASPAQAGEAWLRKYLVNKGKTEEDLATRLWESNLTAIAELCDDSFEEHILAYPPEKTGLHLHGLNVRSKEFKTLSTELVDAFADEWGFIKTATITLNTVQEVKDFTNTCAETSEWNGEAVEGFVVRTHVAEPATSAKNLIAAPYKPGSPFFFQVKFVEPFVMYRDWRDVTRTLLRCKHGNMKASSLPKPKMRRKETKVYVKWVIEEITKDRRSFKKGKGIIAAREKFLKFLETKQGMEELARAKDEIEIDAPGATNSWFNKTIIVPVGIPGCGKTSVSLALAHIFGFGHTQSDDVHIKKQEPTFIRNVVDLLGKHNVVIADKDNHLRGERRSLRDASATKFRMFVRLLALNWSLDQPPATIHRICGDRIQQRGDNHQTLRADSSDKYYEEVIWTFISGTQKLDPMEANNIVEMKFGESLKDSVKRAVEGCAAVLGLDMPSDEKIQEALDKVRSYAPAVKKDSPKNKKTLDVQYYGLLPEVDVKELIDRALANEDKENKDFWRKLKAGPNVTKLPQVMIVHKDGIEAERDLWNRCTALHETATPPLFKFKLSNLLWDGSVLAITVDDFDVETEGSSGSNEGREFVSNFVDDNRSKLFIMVGMKTKLVKRGAAKTMVKQWRKDKKLRKIKSFKLADEVVYGRIKGLGLPFGK